MLGLKKIFLGLGFLFLFSLGGAGTQSNSLIMQGMGFVGILLGLIILYIFGKMVWKGIGCMPLCLILIVIGLFMMYSLGMFNNGVSGVGDAMLKFIGYAPKHQTQNSTVPSAQPLPDVYETEKPAQPVKFNENFAPEKPDNHVPQQVAPVNADFGAGELFADVPVDKEVPAENQQEQSGSLISNVISSIKGKPSQAQQKAFNPNDYPVVYGSVRVINADTFEMYGNYFRLFGVDAPESNQICSDKQGRSYNCGREAARWLKSWIEDNELECHVVKQDTKGNMIGTCSYGQYDIGAALVNAGWAVADTKYTDVYYPYEIQAQQDQRGLWRGKFYRPEDWRKIQSRQPKVKIIKKSKKKGMFGI